MKQSLFEKSASDSPDNRLAEGYAVKADTT